MSPGKQISKNNTPISSDDMANLICILRAGGMDDVADEIEASIPPPAGESPSWGFFEGPGTKSSTSGRTVPEKNQTWVRSTRPGAKAGTTEKIGSAERAAKLAHEWHHVRELEGHDGTDQTTVEDIKDDPCVHVNAYWEQMELLCELKKKVPLPNDPSGNPPCDGSLSGPDAAGKIKEIYDRNDDVFALGWPHAQIKVIRKLLWTPVQPTSRVIRP